MHACYSCAILHAMSSRDVYTTRVTCFRGKCDRIIRTCQPNTTTSYYLYIYYVYGENNEWNVTPTFPSCSRPPSTSTSNYNSKWDPLPSPLLTQRHKCHVTLSKTTEGWRFGSTPTAFVARDDPTRTTATERACFCVWWLDPDTGAASLYRPWERLRTREKDDGKPT